MTPHNLQAFSQDLIDQFGIDGAFEALKRAKLCEAMGDQDNAKFGRPSANA